MARPGKGGPSPFGIIFKAILVLIALYCLYIHYWVGIFIVVPVFFVDFLLSKVKTDTVGTLFKLFILFQGLLIWYIASNNFFRSPSSPQSSSTSSSSLLSNHIKFNVKHVEQDRVLPQSEAVEVPPEHRLSTDVIYPAILSPLQPINTGSSQLIRKVLGDLFASDFPDLKHVPVEDIRSKFPTMFNELPAEFLTDFKNPCWVHKSESHRHHEGGSNLACLPYAYVLGQPKCGTSDLFERMKKHQQIILPRRKEVRWFTRGEFMTKAMAHEDEEGEGRGPTKEKLMGPSTSLYSFTRSFEEFTRELESSETDAQSKKQLITVDGGPHTFWWPTQSPDGSFLPDEVPPNQMVHALQPDAKFIITVNNPVTRMYSDYYFLNDDLKPVRNNAHSKSPEQFHERAVSQVNNFKSCVAQYISDMKANNKDFLDSHSQGRRSSANALISEKEHPDFPLWFRASQMCAHDRHRFGVGGFGRITIGLYVLYYEKWLEYFAPSQFMVTRLEDYRQDPKAYMQRIFSFLVDQEPEDWDGVLNGVNANVHRQQRDEMLEETRILLNEFYKPYNKLFVEFLNNPAYNFLDEAGSRDNRPAVLPVPKAKEPMLNQHGIERHMEHDPHAPGLLENGAKALTDALHINTGLIEPNRVGYSGNLRGKQEPENPKELILLPKNFDIEGLPEPKGLDTISTFNVIVDSRLNAYDPAAVSRAMSVTSAAAQQLCVSVYGLDLAAVKFLLYDIGIPGNVINNLDNGRNAFHAVSLLHTMTDAHSKSHLFALLKGFPSWMTPHLDPSANIPIKQQSPISSDVLTAIAPTLLEIAEWLLRAGADPSLPDSAGNTPLHHAAYGGQPEVVKFLIEKGKVDVNAVNHEMRTALHYATAYGQVKVIKLLLDAGADSQLKDANGVCAYDIISNPGVISRAAAKEQLNIEQRPAKQIVRQIHPELFTNMSTFGWEAGTGGWGPERLKGFEQDMDCSAFDQYWAHEITGQEIYDKYILRNAPVLIRGLLTDWDVEEKQSMEALLEEHGDLEVQVSDIPYAQKFGGAEKVDMKLSEYIKEVREHRMVGGSHPWYVFKGHPVPSKSEDDDSLVKYEHFPTPSIVKKAFELASPPATRGRSGAKSREMFVNAQWALGGEGTGAPIHFHNTAWSALVYGAKKWIIYPPSHMIMSNRQILDYYESELPQFEARGIHAVTCVQTAGDVVIIPESWAHGVLNIQESVAIATEFKQSQWRIRPNTNLFIKFPNFDGHAGRRAKNAPRKAHPPPPPGDDRRGGRRGPPEEMEGGGRRPPPQWERNS